MQMSSRESGLLSLPFEVLVGILVHLSPEDLGSIRLVCKALNDILERDLSWKEAFFSYFNLVYGEPIFARRISTRSWRSEFFRRVRLLQTWQKARTATIVTEPDIGPLLFPIHEHAALNARLETLNILTTSFGDARAARVLPFLGKTVKPVHAPPLALLEGEQVTSSHVTGRETLIWGLSSGSVVFKTTAMPANRNERAWHLQQRPIRLPHVHRGHVTAVTSVQESMEDGNAVEIYVTASSDGRIGVHRVRNSLPTETHLSKPLELAIRGDERESITSLAAFSSGSRDLLFGTSFGAIRLLQAESSQGGPSNPVLQCESAVRSISFDKRTSCALVQAEDGLAFFRFEVTTQRALRMSPPDHIDGSSVLTCVTPCFDVGDGNPVHDASMPFVVAGDAHGRVFFWPWVGDASLPSRSFQASRFKISALAVSDAILVVGSVDGSYRAFDLLALRLIRVFKGHASKLSTTSILNTVRNEQETRRWAVNSLLATNDTLLAAIGGRILAWNTGDRKAKASTPSKKPRRSKPRYELHDDLEENLSALRIEETERVSRLQSEHARNTQFGLPPDLRGLSEQEAFDLALMLSQEGASTTSGLASSATMDTEEDLRFALQLSLAESESLKDT